MANLREGIDEKLSTLQVMSRQQLLDLWRELYRRQPPLGLRREILISFLAYRIQENAYGGLTSEVRTELLRLTKHSDSDRSSKKRAILQRLPPGTRIIREWNRENHEIFVIDDGYEYRGDCYRSLSQIARTITGTRWSGPAFFGLNKSAKRQHERG